MSAQATIGRMIRSTWNRIQATQPSPAVAPVAWQLLSVQTTYACDTAYAFALDEPAPNHVVRAANPMHLRGWAYHPAARLRVRVAINGKELVSAVCARETPGVAAMMGGDNADRCGFDLSFPNPAELAEEAQLTVEDLQGRLHGTHVLKLQPLPVPEQTFFVHIAKTGGTTVNTFVERCVGSSRCIAHVEGMDSWRSTFPGSNQMVDQVYLSGHVTRLVAQRKLDPSLTLFTTVLRDPLAHLASHFGQFKSLMDPGQEARLNRAAKLVRRVADELAAVDLSSVAELRHWVPRMSRPARKFFDNCQVRYLAARENIEQVEELDLEAAIESLDSFGLVGTNRNLGIFMEEMVARMGYPVPTDAAGLRVNVARQRYGLDLDDPEVRECLAPLHRFDDQLYRHAQEIAVR